MTKKLTKPTNQLLFDEIVNFLREKNKIPDILDYYLHEHNVKEFSDYQFGSFYRLDYGGNEGIYLDCCVEGICDDTNKTVRIPLGTFKTLLTSEEAMEQMGILAASFTIALSSYVNKHLDDFTWKGADVNFYDETDKYKGGYTCPSMERALQLAEEKKAMYSKVVVRANNTREETVIKDTK